MECQKFPPSLKKDLSTGRIILGRCFISDDDPKWGCADCQMVISKKSLAPKVIVETNNE
jgi:hypothetical protein